MIYFDSASTGYVYEEAIDIITNTMRKQYGNPSNLYDYGVESSIIIENNRRAFAEAIGAYSDEIFFTSCASESNAFAINQCDICYCSKYEHHDIIDHTKSHTIIIQDFKKLFEADKNMGEVLFAHMLVNNETGHIYTDQIKELMPFLKENNIMSLVDATQALGNIPINAHELGVDFMSFSLHKIHAPKGIGVLYISRETQHKRVLYPIIYGSQEKGYRGGTENVPYISCVEYCVNRAIDELKEKQKMCAYFADTLCDILDENHIDYINISEFNPHICSTLNLAFKNVNNDALMLMLNEEGICVSTGSACTSGNLDPSHVLVALNIDPDYIGGAIRISMGLNNTIEEVKTLGEAIVRIIKEMEVQQ